MSQARREDPTEVCFSTLTRLPSLELAPAGTQRVGSPVAHVAATDVLLELLLGATTLVLVRIAETVGVTEGAAGPPAEKAVEEPAADDISPLRSPQPWPSARASSVPAVPARHFQTSRKCLEHHSETVTVRVHLHKNGDREDKEDHRSAESPGARHCRVWLWTLLDNC